MKRTQHSLIRLVWQEKSIRRRESFWSEIIRRPHAKDCSTCTETQKFSRLTTKRLRRKPRRQKYSEIHCCGQPRCTCQSQQKSRRKVKAQTDVYKRSSWDKNVTCWIDKQSHRVLKVTNSENGQKNSVTMATPSLWRSLLRLVPKHCSSSDSPQLNRRLCSLALTGLPTFNRENSLNLGLLYELRLLTLGFKKYTLYP